MGRKYRVHITDNRQIAIDFWMDAEFHVISIRAIYSDVHPALYDSVALDFLTYLESPLCGGHSIVVGNHEFTVQLPAPHAHVSTVIEREAQRILHQPGQA